MVALYSPTVPSTSRNLIIFCGPNWKVSSLPCPSKRSERNISPSRAKASFIIRRNYTLLADGARARSLLCLHTLNIITARSQNQIWAENYINDDPSAAKSFVICNRGALKTIPFSSTEWLSLRAKHHDENLIKATFHPKTEMKEKVGRLAPIKRQFKWHKRPWINSPSTVLSWVATAGAAITAQQLCEPSQSRKSN